VISSLESISQFREQQSEGRESVQGQSKRGIAHENRRAWKLLGRYGGLLIHCCHFLYSYSRQHMTLNIHFIVLYIYADRQTYR
jgi:hypothetical protein